MASTYLTYTAGNLPTMTKFTFSVWLKRAAFGANQRVIEARVNGTNLSTMYIQSDEKFAVYQEAGGSTKCDIKTDMKMRDASGWYHVVVAVDTTLASGVDRVKIYINGVDQELTRSTQQVQDEEHNYCRSNCATILGTDDNGSGVQFYGGSMGFAIFCVGTAYAATDFGEFDSNGVWKIKIAPSVTYGTDGFFILKNGNSVTDQSGEGNNFTVGAGNLTNNEDCPSNVFCTGNSVGTPRLGGGSLRPAAFSNCNNTLTLGSGGYYSRVTGTLGASSGKYYWEIKMISDCDSNGEPSVGIIGAGGNQNNYTGYTGDPSMLYKYNGQKGFNNAGDTTYGNSYTNGDIIGVALDLDNNAIYMSKNGAWENSGDPTSGASTTGAMYSGTGTTDGFDPATEFWTPFFIGGSSNNPVISMNFGNGYFGTTAISSAGTNASNNGVFEYDVPTGYTALCTKGLNGE